MHAPRPIAIAIAIAIEKIDNETISIAIAIADAVSIRTPCQGESIPSFRDDPEVEQLRQA
ncbi:hypothetical protein JCM31598_36220 [Desulfonatronum parangueonense]